MSLQWSMNPVPTVYPQNLLINPSSLPVIKLLAVVPEKGPSQMNSQHFSNVI